MCQRFVTLRGQRSVGSSIFCGDNQHRYEKHVYGKQLIVAEFGAADKNVNASVESFVQSAASKIASLRRTGEDCNM